jgi:hypothetical protein
MARPKEMENGVRVSVVIDQKQHDWLRHMAIKMSSKEGRQIGISEAIRMAVAAAYPVPKNGQIDMFTKN